MGGDGHRSLFVILEHMSHPERLDSHPEYWTTGELSRSGVAPVGGDTVILRLLVILTQGRISCLIAEALDQRSFACAQDDYQTQDDDRNDCFRPPTPLQWKPRRLFFSHFVLLNEYH